MQQQKRILHLDICDHNRNKLCSLYDNRSHASGQAYDVFITTERNGWKELSFSLPSVCVSDRNTEPNYRLDYLKTDYLIRAIDEEGADWFIISEPRITHKAFSKTIDVIAGHTSQLLKMKNYGLEFSDEYGNNIGTAEELGNAILDGTGWRLGYVYQFAEKDGSTKYRTLQAPAKTGAFKLMSIMCELFDAKPIYHGDDKTVDIVPINPFSKPGLNGRLDLPDGTRVVELHYGTNVSNVSRTLNTENLVTKLYVYGSYGDDVSGYCGIDECEHIEHTLTTNTELKPNTSYYFGVVYVAPEENETETTDAENDNPEELKYFSFTPDAKINLGTKLIFSLLDASSMMYIWDDTNKKAYPVRSGQNGEPLDADTESNYKIKNWFQFLMNYDYYRETGLLTDDHIQHIAEYHRSAPAKYEEIQAASLALSDLQTQLAKTIGVIDFCKLDIKEQRDDLGEGYMCLVLDRTKHEDGVIYRTDYDVVAKRRFKWKKTDELNTDGDPINDAASVLYVLHYPSDPDTNSHITWDKAYLKKLDDEDDPTVLTFWAEAGTIAIDPQKDKCFLFSYSGVNGTLGALESNDEAAAMTLEDTLKVATVDHPVYFTTSHPGQTVTEDFEGYAWKWWYDYKSISDSPKPGMSQMYFCYKDHGDTQWWPVYFQDTEPVGASPNQYWFNWRNSVLSQLSGSTWEELNTDEHTDVSTLFSSVYTICRNRDRYLQGVYPYYAYVVPSGATLPAGNYYIENEYSSYWAFTTTKELHAGDVIVYDYDRGWVKQFTRESGDFVETMLKPKGYRFDNVLFHSDNVLIGKSMEDGDITTSGELEESTTKCRSQSYISVVPSTRYKLTGWDGPASLCVHFYNSKRRAIKANETNPQVSFQALQRDGDGNAFIDTPPGCTYIKFHADSTASAFADQFAQMVMSATNKESVFVIDDLTYCRLDAAYGTTACKLEDDTVSWSNTNGRIIGLIDCFEDFGAWADEAYQPDDPAYPDNHSRYSTLKKRQDELKTMESELTQSLGDLYREGWWQDENYVDGDEEKLRDDAMENLNEISKPEATYNITYLDLYGSDPENVYGGASELTGSESWPDLYISDAVHLVDPDIAVNTWAYFDKIQKCYDQPRKTKTTINTRLSTIGQHSFTDVLTNIANVASAMKGKMSYYDNNAATSVNHELAVELAAGILATDKDLTSTYNKVEQIGDTVVHHSSQIKQTATEISQTVERVGNIESKSIIRQTADAIRMIVGEETNDNKFRTGGISIENDEINLGVRSGQSSSGESTPEDPETPANVDPDDNAESTEGESGETPEDPSTAYKSSNLKISTDGIFFNVDENNDKGELSITPEQILLGVSSVPKHETDSEENEIPVPENASVSISRGGVNISGATFTVDGGNFEIDNNGVLSAYGAHVNGVLQHNGFNVLTNGYDVLIQSNEPLNPHEGMLWICPVKNSSGGSSGGTGGGGGESGEGGGSTEEPTEPVVTGQVMYIYHHTPTSHAWVNADLEDIFEVVGSSNSFASGSTSCNYSVTVRVKIQNPSETGQKVGCELKLTLKNGSKKVALGYQRVNGVGAHSVTFNVTEQATWLGYDDSITFVLEGHPYGNYSASGAYFPTQDIVLTCVAN